MVRASRKRRIEVAGEEALETIVKDAEDSVLHAKPDEQLFVLDRRGSQRKRRRIEKGLVPGVRVARKSSKAEEKLIAKYAKKAGAGKSAAKPPGSDAPYDAWADGENDAIASVAAVSAGITVGAGPGAVTGTAGAAATRANGRLAGKGRRERKPAGLPVALKAPTAPLPGQSYNPTANDHQDAVAEAVALELRRQEIIAGRNAPVSTGLSDEVRALLLPDGDDDASSESDDDDGDGADAAATGGGSRRNKGKLTRAERNRQARRRATEAQERKRKRLKEERRRLEGVKALAKEVEEDAAEKERQRAARKALAKDYRSALPPRPEAVLATPSIPVSLATEGELTGSLRMLKTQSGSVWKESVHRLQGVGVHPDPAQASVKGRKSRPAPLKQRLRVRERYRLAEP